MTSTQHYPRHPIATAANLSPIRLCTLSACFCALAACSGNLTGNGDPTQDTNLEVSADAMVMDAWTDSSGADAAKMDQSTTDHAPPCREGYRANVAGDLCVDIDECGEETHDCQAPHTCANTPGGFDCACAAGWELAAGQCRDVDECAGGTHDCGAAACINIEGSFTCGVDLKSFFAITFWWDPPTRSFEGSDFDLVKAANFNLVPSMWASVMKSSALLSYAHERGMRSLARWEGDYDFKRITAAQVDAAASQMVERYAKAPGMFGYWLTDEPNAAEFPMLARANAKLLELDPHHVPYINLYPIYANSTQLGRSSYDTYVRDFMATVRPKVLCYDNYVLSHSSFFLNMEIIRKYALQYDVPFWYVLLSTQHFSYPNPGEGLLRWQVYAALAYGAKGISYYTYWCREDDDYPNALVNKDGSLDAKYEYAKRINAGLMVLGPILGRLKSRAVYHAQPPSHTTGVSSSGWVTRVEGGPAIIGELEGHGLRYVLIMNRDPNRDISYSVSMANWVTSIGRVNKHSTHGDVIPLRLSGGAFDIRLKGGDGELLLLNP